MKVLLFGAGTSKSACYSLARELMKTIERDVAQSRNLVSEDNGKRWKQWKEVRKEAPGPLRLLLKDPNPEVALFSVR